MSADEALENLRAARDEMRIALVEDEFVEHAREELLHAIDALLDPPPPDPMPTGRWSVEDGQPYWVDDQTEAHIHPGLLSRHEFRYDAKAAWRSLADLIWRDLYPNDSTEDE